MKDYHFIISDRLYLFKITPYNYNLFCQLPYQTQSKDEGEEIPAEIVFRTKPALTQLACVTFPDFKCNWYK